MADTKISDDPAVTSPADTDLLPVVAGGANSKFTFASLKAYLLSGLATFTSAAKGLVPASGGGTLNFLRADGSWAAPPTGGGGGGVQNNFAATAPPTATDDGTKGYAAGSSWLIPTTGEMWRARDVTTNAARWVRVDTADHPGYVANRWYVPFGAGSSVTGSGLNTTTTYYTFGVIKQRITLGQLGARLTTAAAGGNAQFAVYDHNVANGCPGKLLGSTVSASTATAQALNAAFSGSNPTLEPGNYWFAIQCDTSSAIFMAQAQGNMFHGSTVGSATAALAGGSGGVQGLTMTGSTFGVWPADVSAASFGEQISTRSILIQFMIASVP